MNTATNFFDFANLDDLPAELAEKLSSDTDGAVKAWAEVVAKGAEAGYDSLSINQIIAAAHRMGLDIPTVNTIRSYLNRGVDLKLISKPTRMTYGVPGAESATVAATETAEPETENDPLAGL